MIQALIEIPNIDNLTCGDCPCRDGGSDFCNLKYAIDGDYRGVHTVYNSRPENCPVKYISTETKTGHWIGIDEEPHEDYECDKCGYTISTYTANIEPHTEYKFCPNCGCRMVEPQESEDEE